MVESITCLAFLGRSIQLDGTNGMGVFTISRGTVFGLYIEREREKKYKSVSTRTFVPVSDAIARERAVHSAPW